MSTDGPVARGLRSDDLVPVRVAVDLAVTTLALRGALVPHPCVRSGLTGLWQVSGRSDLTFAQSIRLDLAYVDQWSLRLDLEIARSTVGAVLRRRGSY